MDGYSEIIPIHIGDPFLIVKLPSYKYIFVKYLFQSLFVVYIHNMFVMDL